MKKWCKNLLFGVGFVAALSSCGDSEKSVNEGLQVIDLSNNEILNTSEVFTDVEVIPLRIPESVSVKLSGFDATILWENDFFYFYPGGDEGTILKFSMDGELITTFNKMGGGPGEYPRLSILTGTENGGLEILSYPNKLFRYDADFNFISEAEFPRHFYRRFLKMGESYLGVVDPDTKADDNGYGPSFIVVKPSETEGTFLSPKAAPIADVTVEGDFASFDGGLILNFGGSDTLYHYINNETKARFVINLGSRQMPESIKTSDLEELFPRLLTEQPYSFNAGNIQSAGDVFRFSVFFYKKTEFDPEDFGSIPVHDIYYHPASGKAKITSPIGNLGNNSDKRNSAFFSSVMYAEQWQGILEKDAYGTEISEKIRAATEKLVDSEDPVVIRYKVKF